MKKSYLLIVLFVGVITFTVQAQTITTVAGTGTSGYNGDGIAATIATLNQPSGVLVDSSGNIIIADFRNNRVRKVGTNGFISTIAGNGNQGYNGDNIAATVASLFSPTASALDKSGNLYVPDGNNNRIRKVGTGGFISTIAGTGTYGYNGDNTAATVAQVNFPTDGITTDSAGNIYFADTYNYRIRKISTAGIITTVAGSGVAGFSGDSAAATAAKIDLSYGLAFDRLGNLYIADGKNNRIRKVSPEGIITTVAGTGTGGYNGDGILAKNAQLNYPEGVAVDAAGNVYIGDYMNNRVRKVTVSTGIISTVAGTGVAGYNGDNIAATGAQVWAPIGLTFDKFGNLYIADFGNSRIRKVDNVGPILPLRLIRFAGAVSNNIGLLEWQTANEVNTQKFGIERSQDGFSYTLVGEVVAKNTNGNNSYSFTDKTIQSGSNYYRLKMTDKDGTVTYSKVVQLEMKETLSISISPNPVGNTANVSLYTDKTAKYTLQILTVDGKQVRQMVVNAVAGTNRVTIDLNGIISGQYILIVSGNDEFRTSVKFTK